MNPSIDLPSSLRLLKRTRSHGEEDIDRPSHGSQIRNLRAPGCAFSNDTVGEWVAPVPWCEKQSVEPISESPVLV